jgi:hypothetical protein
MKRKMSWRSLKFIPAGGDESQAITRKDKGFMHLCELWRYYPERFRGYSIHDTKGMFQKYGPNNVDVSWSDFRLALVKFQMKSPPEKPSVFCGEYFPPDHTIRMRKRLLAAALREYISAQCLAEDLLEWLSIGREDDIRKFMLTLLHGVGWLKEPPRTPDAATAKPIDPPKGEILMMG